MFSYDDDIVKSSFMREKHHAEMYFGMIQGFSLYPWSFHKKLLCRESQAEEKVASYEKNGTTKKN